MRAYFWRPHFFDPNMDLILQITAEIHVIYQFLGHYW